MIVIYGKRAYGRVDQHDGEYAQTTFFHLYYVPLVPMGSFWVTNDAGGQRVGHAIVTHGPSVLAAYLRLLAPVIAIGAIASGTVVGMAIGAALAALSVWSWTRRSLRGELAHKRSDFHRLAYGTRCDPKWMAPQTRKALLAQLTDRWARSGKAYAPNDVGTRGEPSPDEAVLAYGLLRLSAVEHGGADEAAAAERILRGQHQLPAAGDGPYRGGALTVPSVEPDSGSSIA